MADAVGGATGAWPVTLHFGDRPITFASAQNAMEWLVDERKFWSKIVTSVNGAPTGAMQGNLNLLGNLANKSGNDLVSALAQLAESYEPSSGPLGVISKRAGTPNQAAIAFQEASNPGRANWNVTSESIAGQAYAAIARAVGPEFGALEEAHITEQSVRAALLEVERIRSGDAQELKRLGDLIARCEEDWKNKLEGFEAKIALSAPKSYWTARAEKHSGLARSAARQWFWALVLIAGISSGAVFYFLLQVRHSDIATEAVFAIQRVVVLGTVLAFGVWWLRQKLRDRRSHEHLADDAAERVTMIETYAAMRAAGLQDANLAPILTALYRPAMSGFAEDAGPVLPLEILLKSVSDTVARKAP